MSEKITRGHLELGAILYVRQSSLYQVVHNEESGRLQYGMEERLHDLGWREVEIIDEDLGRSAAGVSERKGFARMVAEVCLGKIGAVAAREVSRFARNNREWHLLIEMCAVVHTLLIDHESVYDPRNSNDRLLLGLKGNLSAYELDTLRHRALAARRAKAQRGKLFPTPPPGFVKTDDGRLEKDPDRRVQRALELVFEKTLELGSARQTTLWLLEHRLDLPAQYHNGVRWETVWRRATHGTVLRMLNNPMYAGDYVYGKRQVVTRIDEGVIQRNSRIRPGGDFEVRIADHHEGYVSREQFERVQEVLNRNRQVFGETGAAKRGNSLLAGLLRCRRCGLKLRVGYSGNPRRVRYACNPTHGMQGEGACLAFGGIALERAIAAEVLRVVEPGALVAAAPTVQDKHGERAAWLDALEHEVEAARYEARRAQRQYDAVDPEQRLVAAELEARWNRALEKVGELEKQLEDQRLMRKAPAPDLATLRDLARDLSRVWDAEQSDPRLKKRIVRALIEEIAVDRAADERELQILIHWKGGVHTELSVICRRRGQHFVTTSDDIVDAIRVLSRICTDDHIAALLTRNGFKTSTDLRWTRTRLKGIRLSHGIAVFDPQRKQAEGWMTLSEAATHLDVSPLTVRRAVERGEVEALHPLSDGPWLLTRTDLDRPEVQAVFEAIRARRKTPGLPPPDGETPMFPGWQRDHTL